MWGVYIFLLEVGLPQKLTASIPEFKKKKILHFQVDK